MDTRMKIEPYQGSYTLLIGDKGSQDCFSVQELGRKFCSVVQRTLEQ